MLAEVDLRPPVFEVARLDGFEITIGPRANLVPSEGAAVYGVLAEAAQDELGRLYAHARDVPGESYLPEAVLVQTRDLKWRPEFPAWYVERLAGFLPPPS